MVNFRRGHGAGDEGMVSCPWSVAKKGIGQSSVVSCEEGIGQLQERSVGMDITPMSFQS